MTSSEENGISPLGNFAAFFFFFLSFGSMHFRGWPNSVFKEKKEEKSQSKISLILGK